MKYLVALVTFSRWPATGRVRFESFGYATRADVELSFFDGYHMHLTKVSAMIPMAWSSS